jgi:hypothetical protein
MKLIGLIIAFSLAGFGSCSVKAQTVTPVTIVPAGTMQSPNLIYMTTNPYGGPAGTSPGSWSNNFTTTTSNGGGAGPGAGGNQPGYNTSTGTFMFGYTQAQIAYTYALSAALKNSGMTWTGYNYSWDYINQGDSRGTLAANLSFNATNGSSLYSKSWTLGPTTGGWTTMSGTESLTDQGLLVANLANFRLSFTGKDDRYWAGYWGPQVRNPTLSINYTFDQCSTDPLSSPSCPGYAAAYLTQQCTANPLYNTSCPGYAAAYQIQQCTTNPLFDQSCPGYAAAYLNQQCSANPLYSTTCPGYEQAYLDAQCIKDSLYSTRCEGYKTAYAIKYLVQLDSTTSSAVNGALSDTAAVKANDPANTKVATNAVSTTVNTDGSISTGVSTTGDTNVDKAIANKASTTNTTPTAVQLAPPPPGPGPSAQAPQERKPEGKPEGKEGGGPAPQMAQAPQGGGDKPQPTARQEIAERRAEAAKKEAVEKGKNLANEMGKVADMEQQKQIQNVVIQAMGFTPGFDAYGKTVVPDVVGYKPFTVYNNQKTIDNRANLRMFGGTDRLHNEMVDSQYNKGN